jgi:hypothetical protein
MCLASLYWLAALYRKKLMQAAKNGVRHKAVILQASYMMTGAQKSSAAAAPYAAFNC